jgi:LmbE family N-acetylglucosaminyl deacetylase
VIVLAIAAHPDDEVLGPGAALASLRAAGAEIHVAIVTEGSSAQYPNRPELIIAKREQARNALNALGGGTLHFGDLPDMRLDTVPLVTVNAFLERVVASTRPEIVFTHHHDDLNRDHRIVHEASVVACRPSADVRELLAYEVLGVTNFGGTRASFQPNVFYRVDSVQAKVEALRAYDLELRAFPHPRSPEALEAHARVNGALCGARFAEAFHAIRVCR